MKVKKIENEGIKNIIIFKNGLQIAVPNRLEIQVGMDLKLKFEQIIPIEDYVGEFALVFTLSNEEINFNLYVNDIFCDGDDDMNLYSAFVDYGDFDIKKATKKSPIDDLCRSLETDEGYYIGWQSNLAMAFKDNYNWSKDKTDIHKIANDSADYFLKQIMR